MIISTNFKMYLIKEDVFWEQYFSKDAYIHKIIQQFRQVDVLCTTPFKTTLRIAEFPAQLELKIIFCMFLYKRIVRWLYFLSIPPASRLLWEIKLYWMHFIKWNVICDHNAFPHFNLSFLTWTQFAMNMENAFTGK